MATKLYNFMPAYGTGQNGTATSTSAALTIPGQTCDAVRFVNEGDYPIYIRTWASQINGTSNASVDATSADLKIPQHDVYYGTKDLFHDRISVLAPDGDAEYNVICGSGS